MDCVEVNSSFYRPPVQSTTDAWIRRTASFAHFAFTVKLWRRFTHEREPENFSADVQRVRSGLEPLVAAGKLGALLVQFPWSFKRSRQNATWMKRVVEAFADRNPVVEVRHRSWDQPGVLGWLDAHGIGSCVIDQPQFEQSLEPKVLSTGPVGYVRLHGRNHANWFREDAQTFERYDYLYTQKELDPWIARMREIATASEATFVITNNHYRGQALVNALQIRAVLRGGAVPAPPLLREAYPQLRPITRPLQAPAGSDKSPYLFE